MKEEWGIVCLVRNRKKRVSRNWTRGVNSKCCYCVIVFLIEGRQPSFYAEITTLSFFQFPFCLQQSSLSVLHPSSFLVVRHQDSKRRLFPGASRQDLNNHTKILHPGQSHNLVIYMRTSVLVVKHDSRSGGCEFDLPNRLFLSPWSHFTRQTYSCTLWASACVISLARIGYTIITSISTDCFKYCQIDLRIDFHGMLSLLGLFYILSSNNCVNSIFVFTLFL